MSNAERNYLSHWKNISWNQLYSKFFSKTLLSRNFWPKLRESNVFTKEVTNELISRKFLSVIAFCSNFPHCDTIYNVNFFHEIVKKCSASYFRDFFQVRAKFFFSTTFMTGQNSIICIVLRNNYLDPPSIISWNCVYLNLDHNCCSVPIFPEVIILRWLTHCKYAQLRHT